MTSGRVPEPLEAVEDQIQPEGWRALVGYAEPSAATNREEEPVISCATTRSHRAVARPRPQGREGGPGTATRKLFVVEFVAVEAERFRLLREELRPIGDCSGRPVPSMVVTPLGCSTPLEAVGSPL
jgi:hypothetical protein